MALFSKIRGKDLHPGIWGILFLLAGCSQDSVPTTTNAGHEVAQAIHTALQAEPESDDPANYDSQFQKGGRYKLSCSEPLWLIPSKYLPDSLEVQTSNNNVALARYQDRIYVGFRTGKTHFASASTKMYIISTSDGLNWQEELDLSLDADVREPHFLVTEDTLRFYYFKAGTNMAAFEPEKINMIYRIGPQVWSEAVEIMDKGEVHWSMKARNGKYYATSYLGSHYQVFGKSQVELKFRESKDGVAWHEIGDSSAVYEGGVSEVDFEFSREGDLWAVGRLEDGDFSGFGSQIFFASKDSLDQWHHLSQANREAYMSPKIFRHGDDIYLVARRQLGKKPFGFASKILGMPIRRMANWVNYSLSPKTTAIFRLNTLKKSIEHVRDLPGAGDTALPSILRLGKDRFLLANYSSNPKHHNRTWLKGQLNPTYIYLMVLDFTKQ
jgi:hypothetical protein